MLNVFFYIFDKNHMSENIQNRWTVLSLDTTKFTITISDHLANRKKTYHIPYLTHAVIKDQLLLVATSFNKIMEINLANGARKFIS